MVTRSTEGEGGRRELAGSAWGRSNCCQICCVVDDDARSGWRGGGGTGSATEEEAAVAAAQIRVPMTHVSPPFAVGASMCVGRGRALLCWEMEESATTPERVGSRRGAPPVRHVRRGGGDHGEKEGHRMRAASSGEEWGDHA